MGGTDPWLGFGDGDSGGDGDVEPGALAGALAGGEDAGGGVPLLTSMTTFWPA